MIVHIATIGVYANERVEYVITKRKADVIILVHTDINIDYVDNLQKKYESLGITVQCIQVDPWDYSDILGKILSKVVEFRDAEVEFNVSCGTRVMTAAYMAAVMIGSPAYFVTDRPLSESQTITDEALIVIRPFTLSMLTKPKRKILDALAAHDKGVRSQTELGSRTELGASSISKHLKQLELMCYVKRVVRKGKKIILITPLGRIILNLKKIRGERIWGCPLRSINSCHDTSSANSSLFISQRSESVCSTCS